MRDDELTQGQQALREAARAETARVYGQLCPEHSPQAAVHNDADTPGSVTRVTDIRVARNKKRGAA